MSHHRFVVRLHNNAGLSITLVLSMYSDMNHVKAHVLGVYSVN